MNKIYDFYQKVAGWLCHFEGDKYVHFIVGASYVAFVEITSIMEAKVILAKIQRYADACYMVTQGHRKDIEALTTAEDVEGYDYTQGYPEKLAL